jgi:hypothetical protein
MPAQNNNNNNNEINCTTDYVESYLSHTVDVLYIFTPEPLVTSSALGADC